MQFNLTKGKSQQVKHLANVRFFGKLTHSLALRGLVRRKIFVCIFQEMSYVSDRVETELR